MQELSEKLAWQERWAAGRTGWDQGQAHPSLERLIFHAKREGGLKATASFYSAGVGRAHNEAALALNGFSVKAVDLSEEAISAASALYGEVPGLDLSVADFNDIPSDERMGFDAIFDRAMLCALAPETRPSYVSAMKERLRPGGLFCAILFRAVTNEVGPPFPVDEAELARLFLVDFDLCHAAAIPAAPSPAVVKEEWICVLRKKG